MNMKVMSRPSQSVMATTGLRAACCCVPIKNPTTLVSISDKRGAHSQIPNSMILSTDGAAMKFVSLSAKS